MSDPHLRMSDAERERAAAELGEHYAQGRLTVEEHSERLDRIWAARTYAELGPVFADLPGPHRAAQHAPAYQVPWANRPPARPPRRTPSPVVVVLAVVVALAVLTHLPLLVLGLLAWALLMRGAGHPSHRAWGHGCARPRVHRF